MNGKFEYATSGRIAMAIMLLFTSLGHFIFVKGMSVMVPDFVPKKELVVLATGVFEIVLGLGLLLPFHKLTGYVLITFFILIIPANIKASTENINYQTGEFDGNGMTYLWFRVPLQLFFILWVYVSALKNEAVF